jgi:hypothetical protein
MSTNTDECLRQQGTRSASEINDFGNVREVINGKRDNVRLPALDQAEKILLRLALQIDETNRVTAMPRGSSNKFEAERFETKIDLRVHQAGGMNGQEFHFSILYFFA